MSFSDFAPLSKFAVEGGTKLHDLTELATAQFQM